MKLKTWAREPLVHFLLAGAALFAFFAWRGEPADPASRTITISQEDRARLALQWQQTMQRPPTDAELGSLTETWLREEILYREALRLGLDQGDAVVRKRLANKMDYLAASAAETEEPSDQTLRQWLADRPQRFAEDTVYSFDQLYFSERTRAESALASLVSGAGWQALGQTISLPPTAEQQSANAVEGRFGIAFREQLDNIAAPGQWSGPHASGFGWHLIRLRQRDAGEVPPFAQIREQVENDWRAQTLEDRKAKAYQLLRDAYDVTVEK